jgi:hypothetical protein
VCAPAFSSPPSPVPQSGLPALAARKVPFRLYAWQAVLFFAMSVLNNAAFLFNISQPVHVVIRSGNLVVTYLVGRLVGEKCVAALAAMQSVACYLRFPLLPAASRCNRCSCCSLGLASNATAELFAPPGPAPLPSVHPSSPAFVVAPAPADTAFTP